MSGSFDITTNPVHLGLGARAFSLPTFDGSPQWYERYGLKQPLLLRRSNRDDIRVLRSTPHAKTFDTVPVLLDFGWNLVVNDERRLRK